MAERLSEEKESFIREWVASGASLGASHAKRLLDEIDYLRAEAGEGWVSVEERLPEEWGEYAAFEEGDGVYPAVYNPKHKQGWLWCDVNGVAHPTHWRPLPSPPQSTGGL